MVRAARVSTVDISQHISYGNLNEAKWSNVYQVMANDLPLQPNGKPRKIRANCEWIPAENRQHTFVSLA